MEHRFISKLSLEKIELLYPIVKLNAVRILEDVEKQTGEILNIAEAVRSLDHQHELYAKGREFSEGKWVLKNKNEIVTNAVPGLSFHTYGLAFDVSWHREDPYLEKTTKEESNYLWNVYGDTVKKHGMKWGGDFTKLKDFPHAELSHGIDIHECFKIYKEDGLIAVWRYIDGLLII